MMPMEVVMFPGFRLKIRTITMWIAFVFLKRKILTTKAATKPVFKGFRKV